MMANMSTPRLALAFNRRRLRNLSKRQRKILSPKVDRSEVSIY
jgi:hypothetical protein